MYLKMAAITSCVIILTLLLPFSMSKDLHGDGISIQIYDGIDAKPGQFPFIGSLRGIYDSHMCGATLISNDTAVTAAHCFELGPNVDADNLPSLAVFGDLELWRTSPTHHHSTFTAVTHEQYDQVIIKNDIALIYLKSPIFDKYEKNISSIPIANSSNEMSDYSSCFLIGWGVTGDYLLSNVLQYTPLELYNNSMCEERFGYIDETMLCAGSQTSAACSGDSGGPLACYRNDDPSVMELVGVVSFGIPECQAGVPGVYTRVSTFRDWIESRPDPNRASVPYITIYFVLVMAYISIYSYI
ncbi:chymotrypsin-1-like [Apostichopus japonicus]|uniref:chymotrypsin-1-like n=1 Tax=Stichopus japonicus TaxID=307972 RepID=UPI003AB201E7